jgi:hypothetical protein
MITQDNITLGERLQAPTPKFFKTVRNIGLTLVAVAGAILTAPVSLPAVVVTVAGYVATAGTIAAAVASTTVDYKALSINKAFEK